MGRSCTNQVLSLTSYIEAGIQKILKTASAFLDLSSAYDTAYKRMIYKLQQVILCKQICILIQSTLSNRRIIVHINNNKSLTITLKMAFHEDRCWLLFCLLYMRMMSHPELSKKIFILMTRT